MSAPNSSSPDIAGQFREWIGRTLVIEDEVTLPAARRIAAMGDLDPTAFARGDQLPPHWYSMFFTLNARQSQLGHDGHPRKGEFLPPIPLPRRMFVGRQVEFLTPLLIGDVAAKRSEIVSIEQKQGRSGLLIFLTVRHTVEVRGAPALVELQEVVYRESPRPGADASPAAPPDAPVKADWADSVVIDPVQLFRYSALTWNGHRIHYDADYARQQEGYPACVMNGALTVHLLIDSAMRRAENRRLSGLTARLSKPLFVGDTMILAAKERVPGDPRLVDAWVTDANGALAASVSLHFA